MALEDIRWIRSWPNEASPSFRVGRVGIDLVAEWVGLATLRAARDGTRAELRMANADADSEIADKLHRGQVRALLGHLQGKLAIHASAAVFDGRGVALLGDSGVGKSTLAAALCVLHGWEFMADDALAIELPAASVQATRIESHHWLVAESAEALGLSATRPSPSKHPVVPPRVRQESAFLEAIVKLSFDEGARSPELDRLQGRACFQTLSLSAMRFILDEPEVMLRDFQQVASLAERVPVFELRRPLGVAGVAADARAIASLLDSAGRASSVSRMP
jgi:hypothetical protein